MQLAIHSLLAAALSVGISGGALAEQFGTPLTVTVSHSGPFGETQSFTHIYGTTNQVFDSLGFSYTVESFTSIGLGALRFDFSNFAYADFAGETGSISVSGVTDPLFFVGLLDTDLHTIAAADIDGPGSFSAQWEVDDVLATGAPVMYVAWNYKPTPGTAALLGVAGAAGLRRRR